MGADVLDFTEVDRTMVATAGGKGANLADLARVEGVSVPAGFCITTDPFRRMMSSAPMMPELLDRLSRLDSADQGSIRSLGMEIRQTIEQIALVEELQVTISRSVARLDANGSFAVRSSATTEDLAMESSAGQQDTFLNVRGASAIFQMVKRCWASLFTERAVTYRMQHGVDHRLVQMGVVVQEMVFPDVAGTLFTADPVTSDRTIVCIEASFGLGEALVSGLVNPDSYRVRDDEVISRSVGVKTVAVRPVSTGGTQTFAVDATLQRQQALDDVQIAEVARLGRRIEAHFGRPQDVEWCLAGDTFHIVQSRPITTLFPIPPSSDGAHHVYVSVGHQQMMTDAMKPLGLSFWQMTTPRPMAEAGGRLFVDFAALLGTPTGRTSYLPAIDRSDPLMGDALRSIVERGNFIPELADSPPSAVPVGGAADPIEVDPAVVTDLIQSTEASIATMRQDITTQSGPALLEFVRDDLSELRRILFDPRGHQVFMSAMEATWWLNERLEEWLGEKNAADTLARSVPNNVTSEMGLALLDVADAIRPHRQVVAFLEAVVDDDYLDALPALDGGREAEAAIRSYLDSYGMRCVGEIDITRPRWSERPTLLLPLLLDNIRNAVPGAGLRRFEVGREEALEKERDVLTRLRSLPDGAAKARQVEGKIHRVRTFIGYREYPKYGMVSRYAIYKQALLGEAGRLVDAGVLREVEDIFFLRFEELQEVVRTNTLDERIVRERSAAFDSYRSLTPPRVFTSDGEVVTGSYGRVDAPDGALVGLPVSSGTVEGRARVVHDVGQADFQPGDILVTVFTDPSWTPAFLAVTGLVTEVGGLMTHGAVIAREYGLPAVVGVEGATRLIRDGQRIRVHGTEGTVEILG